MMAAFLLFGVFAGQIAVYAIIEAASGISTAVPSGGGVAAARLVQALL